MCETMLMSNQSIDWISHLTSNRIAKLCLTLKEFGMRADECQRQFEVFGGTTERTISYLKET